MQSQKCSLIITKRLIAQISVVVGSGHSNFGNVMIISMKYVPSMGLNKKDQVVTSERSARGQSASQAHLNILRR